MCKNWHQVIGTGGIGTGMLFNLIGDHTLGRDETRLAVLTDFKDYCKQHIILHYLAVLVGSRVKVHAIGMVGADPQGDSLLGQMRAAGIDTAHVAQLDNARTMLAVCFQYPDKTGGNITTSNSACDLVTPAYIEACLRDFTLNDRTLIIAAPEVSVDARLALMSAGKQHGAYVVGSLLSAEAIEFRKKGGLNLVDLLAINIDEAKAVAGMHGDDGMDAAALARQCAEAIWKQNAAISLIITCGGHGAYVFENGNAAHVPVIEVPVVSTAGAGDAFLSGTLSGMALGMCMTNAATLGGVVAAFAVLSPDTIAGDVSLKNLLRSKFTPESVKPFLHHASQF